MLRFLASLAIAILFSACNASDLKEAVDIADGVPRKTIDTDSLGVNAFANDGRFGSAAAQFAEVQSTLRLRFVRILIQWDSNAHPSPGSEQNFSFYDSLIAALPGGLDALLVLTGTPGWMSDSNNWIGGDARRTFVEQWLKPVAQRYGANGRVIGFQVWNEPNQDNQPNRNIGVYDNPAAYVEMLKMSHAVIQSIAPSKLVVTAATTAINQNYPGSLNYNRAMRDAGAQGYSDIWAIHYYGKQYENLIRPGGVRDFTNGLSKPIWVTESGAQGVNKQLAYGQEVWPYLQEKIPGIQRIYQYQFTESTPPESTYGLRNLSGDAAVSDLYVWLRDR
ncbi:MAG: cellulase family glycosylhydrolase [Pseudomonadota bacterium]|jgi:hypothetical protein